MLMVMISRAKQSELNIVKSKERLNISHQVHAILFVFIIKLQSFKVVVTSLTLQVNHKNYIKRFVLSLILSPKVSRIPCLSPHEIFKTYILGALLKILLCILYAKPPKQPY